VKLSLLRNKFVKELVRFNQGKATFSIINFLLLLLVTFKTYDIPKWSFPFLVCIAIFCIWLIGFLLDKTKTWHRELFEQSKRNPLIQEILERLRNIEKIKE